MFFFIHSLIHLFLFHFAVSTNLINKFILKFTTFWVHFNYEIFTLWKIYFIGSSKFLLIQTNKKYTPYPWLRCLIQFNEIKLKTHRPVACTRALNSQSLNVCDNFTIHSLKFNVKICKWVAKCWWDWHNTILTPKYILRICTLYTAHR